MHAIVGTSTIDTSRGEEAVKMVSRASGHHGVVVDESELLAAVDRAFTLTGHGLARWPDPHPDRSPLDEEYSRLLNPAKWRIIGARSEAWFRALVDAGVAVIEREVAVRWRVEPGPVISRTDRLMPLASGALALVVARSRLGDVDDAGVVLGVGGPAVCLTWLPYCGCDACDCGSQAELDCLDDHLWSIVSGAFRRLTDGDREITVLGDRSWSASGAFNRHQIDAILADPSGWEEHAGTSWLTVP